MFNNKEQQELYQNNYTQNINNNISNNISLLNNNNIYERNNRTFNNNYNTNMVFSYAVTDKNKIEPLISQNYQLMSSYPNNINNNQFRNDIQYRTLETKTNYIDDDYYYKYTPKNNNNNNTYNNNKNYNNLIISNTSTINNKNNNDQIFSPNILSNSNNKNASLNTQTQISQEIERQKLKFDEMVERAKNFNNSENFEIDIKKYLPKESAFENSKALRKYKDLIKPNNLNKYACFSCRNNFGKDKDLKYEDIKDNTLSEIPYKNENLFEDELSKSEINFNIQSPCKNKDNNMEKENINKNNINTEQINQDNLRQNLMINVDNNNINNNNKNIIINNSKENNNNQNNLNSSNEKKNHNENLNNIINNSPNNSDICYKNNLNKNDEHINSNLKEDNFDENSKNINKVPFYILYSEKINSEFNKENNTENNNKSENNENNDLNEIEKINIELAKNDKIINNINDYSWYCLNYFNDKQQKIYEEFFNNDNI